MSASAATAISRRRLLARAAGVRPPTDAEVLGELAALEQLAIASAQVVLGSGDLTPATVTLVSTIAAQEDDHLAALGRWPGVALPAAPGFGTALIRALSAVGIRLEPRRLRNELAWLGFLEVVETVLEGAYHTALGQLTDPAAASLAASILASEAQHRTLVSLQRYPGALGYAVPSGVVVGTAPPAPRERSR